MNPLDEAAKGSSAHTFPVESARDDYAIAAPLQVVVDPQLGATLPHCMSGLRLVPLCPSAALLPHSLSFPSSNHPALSPSVRRQRSDQRPLSCH